MCCVLANAWYREFDRVWALRFSAISSRYLSVVVSPTVTLFPLNCVLPARCRVDMAAACMIFRTCFDFAGRGSFVAVGVCSFLSSSKTSFLPTSSSLAGFPLPSRMAFFGSWWTLSQSRKVLMGMLYCPHHLLLLILVVSVFEDHTPLLSSRTASSSHVISPRWTAQNLNDYFGEEQRRKRNNKSATWYLVREYYSADRLP